MQGLGGDGSGLQHRIPVVLWPGKQKGRVCLCCAACAPPPDNTTDSRQELQERLLNRLMYKISEAKDK
ncbi:hypothetical protein RHMOL_Rhmol12G0176500 [Rhododendron molle]|uniref:Uncharacterized protein n=1 Tax=Rhododendron molle TaxID=49168 RepID=A0ACC0LJC3_RHOML|nr:hypothetical protein RHMOL_Rhmol12G0176500 [Rhododendron molle]